MKAKMSELAYHDITVQYVSHYATEIPPSSQNGPENNGNGRVLYTSKNSRSGAYLSDTA